MAKDEAMRTDNENWVRPIKDNWLTLEEKLAQEHDARIKKISWWIAGITGLAIWYFVYQIAFGML